MREYRIDYAPSDANPNDPPEVIFAERSIYARAWATSKARTLSRRRISPTVYAIASEDGRDVGQRVYQNGAISFTEGSF
ncbi:MAG: hypothetical protein WCO83_02450 [Alphaproteobacteria bacterium]